MPPIRTVALAFAATLTALGTAAPVSAAPAAVPAAAVPAAGTAAAGTATAGASAAGQSDPGRLAHGVTLSHFSYAGASGELITVDLADPRVRVDLLHPADIGSREQVSSMVARQGAVAGVNADFFNIEESQHPGVTPTGSSDGPEVTGARPLKAAVPDAQRFGPAMAPGTSTRDVIGVGVDGRARLGTLTLTGTVAAGRSQYPVAGLNQYALPENSIGVFTAAWGSVSRERAVCGSDAKRADACTQDAEEVLVRHGRVAAVSDTPGAGTIAAGDTVLVGREAGADELRGLAVGQHVSVRYRLTGPGVPFRFAVGAAPILRDGAVMPGVDAKTAATRTGAGISANGRRLYLVTVDGAAEAGNGLTLAQLAGLLASFGASDGVNLDGGGSTTCAAKLPGDGTVSLVNRLPDGASERPVANGIGVFSR